jgi:hypothetical protein
VSGSKKYFMPKGKEEITLYVYQFKAEVAVV